MGSKRLGDFSNRVVSLVKDQAEELTQPEVEEAVAAALRRYSRDRPRLVTTTIVGDGGCYYAINTTTFPGWVEGWSQIRTVALFATASPPETADDAPDFVDGNEWEEYVSATDTRYLYLHSESPTASDTVRCVYTTPHTLSDSEWTGPDQDFDAVAFLAASLGLRGLAARYVHTMDSTIGADAVQYRTKSQEAQAAAKEYERLYYTSIGLDPEAGPAAATVFKDWDVMDSRGRDRLFKSKASR